MHVFAICGDSRGCHKEIPICLVQSQSFAPFAGDESYEQIEKGQVPHAHNGSKQDFGDGDEVGKLE